MNVNMSLEPGILTQLPDDELYHLLTLCDAKEVLRLRQVLALIEKYFQNKYLLWDLPLLVIDRIVSFENKEDSVREALSRGDYPEYVTSVTHKEANDVSLIDYAVEKGRTKSAIALMKFEKDSSMWYYLFLSIVHQNKECLLYVIKRSEFNKSLLIALGENMPLDEEDFLWTLKVANPEISKRLVTMLLAKTDMLSPLVIIELLKRMRDEDLLEARRKHLRAFNTGFSIIGADYDYGEEITALFNAERDRRERMR